MILRTATRADIPAIAEAWYAMAEESGLLAPHVDPDWRRYFSENVARGIEDGSQHWAVAETASGIAATGAALLRDPRGSIMPLQATIVGVYTFEPHRKRGYAKALLGRLIEWCEARGCAAVRLRATDAGRPLYESLGFVPSDEMVLRLRG